MKKYKFPLLPGLLLSCLFIACSDDNKEDLPDLQPGEGMNYSPKTPDADQPLTITFKAPTSSALFGYKGEVYIHTGVVGEGDWQYVPAEWNQNIDKCKMTKLEENIWSITLEPDIRQWFQSGKTPIEKLGIVIRSSDGSKKGIDIDSFVKVTDHKYQGFSPAEIKHAALPGNVEEGINVINNTTVTLVLYDKDTEGNHKDFAHVLGDFNNWELTNKEDCQMCRDDAAGCWWITLNNLNPTKEYAFQYYVGTKGGEVIRLADAYCEKILDPGHDDDIPASTYPDNKRYPKGGKGIVSVFKIQRDNYAWSVPDFKMQHPKQPVIYEMHLRDFTADHSISGALQKLDYLKNMGVDAIELMPVQEFDGNDSWGYNPCFFFALDKAYGTPKMYKDFIDACHRKGMAVILDVVYNHATGNMPFARLYWDSAKNKTARNNPYFNTDAPHPYSVFQDFNHESPLVRKFVKRNLKFLLDEYKIDGFRFDLTKGSTQTASTEATASNYDAARIAILKDYHSAVKAAKSDALVIFEHFCEKKEEQELAAEGIYLWRNMNNAYCQSAMGWKENSGFDGLYESTPSWVGFMESHDEERMGYKQTQWGNGVLQTDLPTRIRQLAANAAFFFTVPGPKMIWQFGELGYDFSINSNETGTAVSEEYRTSRKPIRWDYYENATRKELFEIYSQLIDLRNEKPSLFEGNATLTWRAGASDWDQGRSLYLSGITGEAIAVVGNFSNADTDVTFPGPTGEWRNYFTGKRNCNGKSHCSRQSFHSVYPFLTDSGTERNINEEKPFIIKINIRIVSHSNLIMYICRALSILIEEQYYFSNFIRMVTNVEMFIFIRFLIA